MNATRLAISDVVLLEPTVFGDDRGFFFESFNQQRFEEAIDRTVNFVQESHSCSAKGVLRSLHYQTQLPQGKLVRVTQGEVFDKMVELRKRSPSFGKWVAEIISAENKKKIWMPEGCRHRLLVLSDTAELLYKTTSYFKPEHERSLLWCDPALDINWPIEGQPVLALKDVVTKCFAEVEVYS